MIRGWLWVRILPLCLLAVPADLPAQFPPVSFSNMGFSMRLRSNNVGAFGHIACPPFNPAHPGTAPIDSLGWQYPLGSSVEHLFGAGLWIGGKLDTATTGTSAPVPLVSVTYEGWTGPYFEMFPGSSVSDTIWCVSGRGAPKPPGWDAYWGTELPYRPIADDNRFCRYTDTAVQVQSHIPMHLKVTHSSYSWSDPSADGIQVVEYRIFNDGQKVIDSLYIAVLAEPAGPGPTQQDQLCMSFNVTEKLAHWYRPGSDSIRAPRGVALIHPSDPADSLRWTFLYFSGPNTPAADAGKYSMISSGVVLPDPWPCLSGMLFLLAAGPFTLPPADGEEPLRIAIAFLAAPTSGDLLIRAQRARELYFQGTGVGPAADGLPGSFALMQNYPNPFNPSTTIKYELPKSSMLRLSVYDILGREVATLVNEEKSAGTHTVQWDAAGVASGVYFCRLRAGDFVQTRRVLMLK
jgi:hypothetical protein